MKRCILYLLTSSPPYVVPHRPPIAPPSLPIAPHRPSPKTRVARYVVHSMVEPMAILTFFEIVYFTLKTRRYEEEK